MKLSETKIVFIVLSVNIPKLSLLVNIFCGLETNPPWTDENVQCC